MLAGILRLWKYQFINITKTAKTKSINILKFDISVISHPFLPDSEPAASRGFFLLSNGKSLQFIYLVKFWKIVKRK